MAPPSGAYGPFHRIQTPTKQTSELGVRQEAEGRICGFAPNWGGEPSVKAYRGPLPRNERGIEFWTNIPPTAGTGTPTTAYWRKGSPGVTPHTDDMVCIAVVVTRRVS